MKPKILIIGATGMAGHIVYFYLKETAKYEIFNAVFRTKLTHDSIIVDVTDENKLKEVCTTVQPDYIINCVGILINTSQQQPDKAIYINAYYPHVLKLIADKINARLIHISTDCVFSGKKGNYLETDFRDADDIYGRSKALGEIINNKDLTLRTSIIGPELKHNGEGLFHWFMNQSKTTKGYKTAIWGGITTLELAKVIDYILSNYISGLVQLSNGEAISKNDLLLLIKEIWSKNIQIEQVDANGIDKSIARSERIRYEIPSYKDMLLSLYEWMSKHKELYQDIYIK